MAEAHSGLTSPLTPSTIAASSPPGAATPSTAGSAHRGGTVLDEKLVAVEKMSGQLLVSRTQAPEDRE